MKTTATNAKTSNNFGNRVLSPNREILKTVLKRWRQKLGYFTIFTALPVILTSHAQETQAGERNKPETIPAGQAVSLTERPAKSSGRSRSMLGGRSHFGPALQNNFISPLSGGDNCPGTPIPGGIYTSANPFTDTGDTNGANNTVSRIYYINYHYYNYDAFGSDHVYSFTISGRGANPQIQVTTTSGTYKPLIYVLRGDTSGGCPSGTENHAFNELVVNDSRWSDGSTASLESWVFDNVLPFNVPLYLFIDSAQDDAVGSGPYTLRIRDLTIAPFVPSKTKFDFDGDRRSDMSVFRQRHRTWYLNRSTRGPSEAEFGLPDDKITPADFDGDGLADVAVYRGGTWYWLKSSDGGFAASEFGLSDDIPVPADYTGDGRAELAVYRGGTWWILDLTNEQIGVAQFGLPTDKPVVADYDGDGKADRAVYRSGEWHLDQSSQGYTVINFGLATDKPVIGDYDGDGKTDAAVYRDGTWYLLRSQLGFAAFQWGLSTDIPVPADYDGDGQTDAAVFRNGTWYMLQSASGVSIQQFGLEDDKPVPAAFLPE